jgi:acyl carrier protein
MTPQPDPAGEILAALRKIAPEMDPTRIDRARPLADQLDIDSMDYLNFLIALSARYGIDIPESRMAHLRSVDQIVDYLAAAGRTRSA